MIGIFSLATLLLLSACSDDKNQEGSHEMSENTMEESNKTNNHTDMHHSSDGALPKGLKEETNPTFPVGSKAMIQADHMEGMKGAEATVVGAFDTIAYIVTYTPANGGKTVTNHKWVIHEELEGASKAPFKQSAEAVINAEHMEGMQGAMATIDSAIETTVYMVNYTSTSGEKIMNHKWVTESELSAIEN